MNMPKSHDLPQARNYVTENGVNSNIHFYAGYFIYSRVRKERITMIYLGQVLEN